MTAQKLTYIYKNSEIFDDFPKFWESVPEANFENFQKFVSFSTAHFVRLRLKIAIKNLVWTWRDFWKTFLEFSAFSWFLMSFPSFADGDILPADAFRIKISGYPAIKSHGGVILSISIFLNDYKFLITVLYSFIWGLICYLF